MIRKDVLSRPEHPATVNLELASDAHAARRGNRAAFGVLESVSNAVKYTPADGTIDIRWWVDEPGRPRLRSATPASASRQSTCRDSPSASIAWMRAFPQLGGSGLGLAIVKHALQRHDARLEIVSEEGKGSTFTCTFRRRSRVQNVSRNHNGD